MVRALSLLPAVRWLHVNGRTSDRHLATAGLASAPFGDPFRPVSLLAAGKLLRSIASAEGPDIACRIVSEASVIELALLGRIAVGTRSPTEALTRIAAALPLFCSHEHLSQERKGDLVVVRHSYAVRFEPETEHLMLQYAAAMAERLCAMTGARTPRMERIEIPPHPESGVEHLKAWFGKAVQAKSNHAIGLHVSRSVADKTFARIGRDRMMAKRQPDILPLRTETFAGSAGIMLASMLEDGLPTVSGLAEAAGTSVRTLQRRLTDDGTSFSALLEHVRRQRATQRLSVGDVTVNSVAAELGYQRQSSLTRAMIRWTGAAPTSFRSQVAG
jgi:AraC-like DNA-binding protein